MSGPVMPRAVRYDKDAYRIQRGDEIVAMALRLSNNRWGMYDTQDRALTKRTWDNPADVAKAYEEISTKG